MCADHIKDAALARKKMKYDAPRPRLPSQGEKVEVQFNDAMGASHSTSKQAALEYLQNVQMELLKLPLNCAGNVRCPSLKPLQLNDYDLSSKMFFDVDLKLPSVFSLEGAKETVNGCMKAMVHFLFSFLRSGTQNLARFEPLQRNGVTVRLSTSIRKEKDGGIKAGGHIVFCGLPAPPVIMKMLVRYMTISKESDYSKNFHTAVEKCLKTAFSDKKADASNLLKRVLDENPYHRGGCNLRVHGCSKFERCHKKCADFKKCNSKVCCDGKQRVIGSQYTEEVVYRWVHDGGALVYDRTPISPSNRVLDNSILFDKDTEWRGCNHTRAQKELLHFWLNRARIMVKEGVDKDPNLLSNTDGTPISDLYKGLADQFYRSKVEENEVEKGSLQYHHLLSVFQKFAGPDFPPDVDDFAHTSTDRYLQKAFRQSEGHVGFRLRKGTVGVRSPSWGVAWFPIDGVSPENRACEVSPPKECVLKYVKDAINIRGEDLCMGPDALRAAVYGRAYIPLCDEAGAVAVNKGDVEFVVNSETRFLTLLKDDDGETSSVFFKNSLRGDVRVEGGRDSAEPLSHTQVSFGGQRGALSMLKTVWLGNWLDMMDTRDKKVTEVFNTKYDTGLESKIRVAGKMTLHRKKLGSAARPPMIKLYVSHCPNAGHGMRHGGHSGRFVLMYDDRSSASSSNFSGLVYECTCNCKGKDRNYGVDCSALNIKDYRHIQVHAPNDSTLVMRGKRDPFRTIRLGPVDVQMGSNKPPPQHILGRSIDRHIMEGLAQTNGLLPSVQVDSNDPSTMGMSLKVFFGESKVVKKQNSLLGLSMMAPGDAVYAQMPIGMFDKVHYKVQVPIDLVPPPAHQRCRLRPENLKAILREMHKEAEFHKLIGTALDEHALISTGSSELSLPSLDAPQEQPVNLGVMEPDVDNSQMPW